MWPLRKTLFSLLAAFCLSSALAAKEETQILFEPGPLYPAHGGPGAKVAFIQNRSAILMGGRGGLVLDGGFGLGVGGYSLSSELLVEANGVTRDLGLSYGGVVVDYSFYASRLYYFNIDLLVGLGQTWSVARLPGSNREYASFFVMEPGLNWMLNVTREARISLGVSARMALGNDISSVLGSELPGFAVTFILWYGKI